MNLLFSLFFGAGLAAWVYSKMSRRIGYGNTENNVILTAVVFFISTIVFYTILVYILNI
jgi:hypothetical protein